MHTLMILGIACGMFIAKTESVRYNDALRFVVVRDGTHTTIAVENRYRGPVEDFALLVPVPVVLQKENVHTLDRSVFDAVDAITAPKLRYYEEDDPCYVPSDKEGVAGTGAPGGGQGSGAGVSVNAQFVVGEYDVVVLSATETAALQTWLDGNGYKVPPTAGTQLAPYIASGSQFFVAKVDPARVTFVDGRAVLSPLRFDYDADDLALPIRLSAANSPGTQDLLVHVIGKGRFEAANYPNLDMTSGFDVTDAAARDFAGFYEALFAKVIAGTPDAVVTEYAGQAYELPTVLQPLGVDTAGAWKVTRLHLRLDRERQKDDLLLQLDAEDDRFETAYAHKTYWTQPVSCANPRWGDWVPSRGLGDAASFAAKPASAPLEQLVAEDVPALGIDSAYEPPSRTAVAPKRKAGCGCSSGGGEASLLLALAFTAAALAPRRARRAPR